MAVVGFDSRRWPLAITARYLSMSDVLMRNPTTGQFESTSRAAIADDYVRDKLGVAFDELLDTYESVQTSMVGRMLFG